MGSDKSGVCVLQKPKSLYFKFGFKTVETRNFDIPKLIEEKHQWCNSPYNEKVLLLLRFPTVARLSSHRKTATSR
jgi:hypothetical protein